MSFLNFGSNITDTYDDPNNVYNIDAVNNYVDHLGATVASDELTITLGRTAASPTSNTRSRCRLVAAVQ